MSTYYKVTYPEFLETNCNHSIFHTRIIRFLSMLCCLQIHCAIMKFKRHRSTHIMEVNCKQRIEVQFITFIMVYRRLIKSFRQYISMRGHPTLVVKSVAIIAAFGKRDISVNVATPK